MSQLCLWFPSPVVQAHYCQSGHGEGKLQAFEVDRAFLQYFWNSEPEVWESSFFFSLGNDSVADCYRFSSGVQKPMGLRGIEPRLVEINVVIARAKSSKGEQHAHCDQSGEETEANVRPRVHSF